MNLYRRVAAPCIVPRPSVATRTSAVAQPSLRTRFQRPLRSVDMSTVFAEAGEDRVQG